MHLKLRLFLWYFHKVYKPFDPSLEPHQLRRKLQKDDAKNDKILDHPPVSLAKISNQHIPMRDGVKIPVRIYRPSLQERLPVIVFYHGGGFVIRSIDSYDTTCRRIAKQCKAVVVSVGYRLAPEHKFPGPVHDAYDAFLWVANHTDEVNVDGSQLTVMGDSAGGNLATVTAIQARDAGSPKIKNQVLIYPVTDGTMSCPSIETFANGKFLTKDVMDWFLDHYKSKPQDVHNPLMSPLFTEEFSNLPRTFLTTAQYDPLKDEGRLYADKLISGGNDVIYKNYENSIHGMLTMPKIMKDSDIMINDIASFLGNENVNRN